MSRRALATTALAGLLASLGLLSPVPARAALSWSSPTSVDPGGGGSLDGLACPSTTQCTAIGNAGQEVTFDPTSPSGASAYTLDANAQLDAVSCPSTSECVATGETIDYATGTDVYTYYTFDPRTPSDVTATVLDVESNESENVGYALLSCPTTTECAAVGDYAGYGWTLDPQSTGNTSFYSLAGYDPPGFHATITAFACASASQCTVAETDGQVVTYDPSSAASTPPVSKPLGWTAGDLACPSTSECVAVGRDDRGATFDPLYPAQAVGFHSSVGGPISCPSAFFCVIGSPGSSLAEGDPNGPSSWTSGAIPNAGWIVSLVCPVVTECVAIDAAGREFTGTQTLPSTPVDSQQPTIAGSAHAGQTLTEVNGRWTNSPTSYAYRWERCDAAGAGCQAVSDATGQTYQVTASDVGGTIRVQETAANAGGAGTAAVSAATAVVLPAPPVSSSPPSITGTAQMGETMIETPGSWSNSPTSYAYQWEDCDASGGGCLAIPGATAQAYVLAAGDVGDTIRVQETAANGGGAGTPAVSSATAVVQAPPGNPGGVSAHLMLGRATVSGSRASLTVACTGTGGGSCSLKAVLTVVETIMAGKITAVAALDSRHASATPMRRRIRHKTVVIGVASVRLPAGASSSVVIVKLNRAGTKLLGSHHRFNAMLTVLVSRATVATRTLTFHGARHR